MCGRPGNKTAGCGDVFNILIKREGRIKHNIEILDCQTLRNHRCQELVFTEQADVYVRPGQRPASQFLSEFICRKLCGIQFSKQTQASNLIILEQSCPRTEHSEYHQRRTGNYFHDRI